jgi:RNA ligase
MISREVLDRYVDEGWLISQLHPTLPLTIYNYSQKTQYEGKWDEVTLQCRGLVMDLNGDLVARPFRKFFNLEEGKHTPTEKFEIYEKLDGSLGIFFYYQGEPVFASRGSFTSEQAVKGRELLDKYNWQYGTYEGYTYLFKILYPANRIVVDYGELSELIVIGVINTDTGREVEFDWMEADGFKLVKRYDFKDYREIQQLNWENSEGFVVRFSNGDRCKIKFADYVKLHKVLTNCSSYDIWENLMTFGKLPEEMLKDVPDEFYDWMRRTEASIRKKYSFTETTYVAWMNSIAKDCADQKEFALRVQQLDRVNSGLMFALYHGNIARAKQIIWKMIKPEYEKPFNT